MGLLRRVLGLDNSATAVEAQKLSVVGESNYQEALMRVSGAPASGEHRHDCAALLVLEPDNPYDPKAVMVQVDGECVGYLSRHNARRFGPKVQKMIEAGEPPICMAFIGRGPDHPNLGISLRIPYDGSPLS
jgi:HIRAN domain